MQDKQMNTKRVMKNTMVLYLRMLIMMVIGLYTSRVTLQALGVEDFGTYGVVGGIVTMLSFLNRAMQSGTQRFINFALGKGEKEELQKVIDNAVVAHALLSVVMFVIAETLGLWFLNYHMNIPEGRMFAANCVYQFSVITFITNIVVVPYQACIIAHEKMGAFAWISMFEVFTKLIAAFVLPIIIWDRLIIYALLLFISSRLVRYLSVWFCKKHFEECKTVHYRIDKSMLKSQLSFSSWTIIGNLGYLGHTQGISIVINLFFGVAINAAQTIANQVNSVVMQFVSNFLVALNPQITKSYAAGQLNDMHTLIHRGCKMAFILIGFFLIPLTIEAPMILSLWLKDVPEQTVIFVRLILLISLFNCFSNVLATSQNATGNIRNYQIVLTLIGLTHIPFAWICFEYGLPAYYAQVVYIVIVIVLQIVRIWFVCRSVQMSMIGFYMDVVVRCMFILVASAAIPCYLHFVLSESILSTMSICLLCVIIYSIFAIFCGFSTNERHSIVKMIRKKYNVKKYVF